MTGLETVNSRKYTYGCSQIGIGWEERIWSRQLFWFLEKKHDNLAKIGVTVIDLCA
jgi:hypothetical protein